MTIKAQIDVKPCPHGHSWVSTCEVCRPLVRKAVEDLRAKLNGKDAR